MKKIIHYISLLIARFDRKRNNQKHVLYYYEDRDTGTGQGGDETGWECRCGWLLIHTNDKNDKKEIHAHLALN